LKNPLKFSKPPSLTPLPFFPSPIADLGNTPILNLEKQKSIIPLIVFVHNVFPILILFIFQPQGDLVDYGGTE
jgi:hypothetical protein